MTTNRVATYEFRVAEHLDDHWSACFENVTIARHDNGTSTLTGPIADQAQLHGILARLRDIGATLVSLHRLDGTGITDGRDTNAGDRAASGNSYHNWECPCSPPTEHTT